MEHDLKVLCQWCGYEIADGEGYLWVSVPKMMEHRRAWEDFEKAHELRGPDGKVWATGFTLAELTDANLPEQAQWRSHHGDCDPDLEEQAYQIRVERIRTWGQLLEWTAHLMQKGGWSEDTDWLEMLRRIAFAQDDRLIALKAPVGVPA